MRLLLCVFCFVFASVYSSTTAQDIPIEVCVSFGGDTLVDPFINVNWNFADDEVTIAFENRNGITNEVYNRSNASDIPMRLKIQQTSVNVTVCSLSNTSSCYSIIAATTPIYNVTWTRVNDTTLEFTCEVACRTPDIRGCNIDLVNNRDDRKKGSGRSDIINGSAEAISSHFVTVVVNNVDPTAECTYTATPEAVVDGASLSLNGITNIIPAAVQVSDSTEYMSSTLMSATPTPLSTTVTSISVMSDMIPTVASMTSASRPISPTVTSDMPTPRVEATDDDSDDDDDDEYLPVIIAASCACVLLLIVAIILLIIIIRVKRRGSGSNLSSPSASKVNNYDDLRDVKYFPMLDSQKSQSPPSDTQNQKQEAHVTKASEYDFPVFTSVEHNPQETGYDSLSAKTAKYDNPDGILNPKSQSNGTPVDNLYDPLTLESVTQPDDAPKSPMVEYDKLMHSPTPQATSFPPSIYDTLSEKNLRAHYEFPDRTDENGMVELKTELRRVASANGDEYTVPQSS